MQELKAAGKRVELAVPGKKGQAYFAFRERPFHKVTGFPGVPSVDDADRAGERVVSAFVSGEAEAVYVVYMRFVSQAVQRPTVMSLLPLASGADDDATLDVGVSRGGGGTPAVAGDGARRRRSHFDCSPGAEELLDDLLPRLVRSRMYLALLEAKASEHASRFLAMKNATDNADDLIRALGMAYNRARQMQITTELCEIMSGVEAMSARRA